MGLVLSIAYTSTELTLADMQRALACPSPHTRSAPPPGPFRPCLTHRSRTEAGMLQSAMQLSCNEVHGGFGHGLTSTCTAGEEGSGVMAGCSFQVHGRCQGAAERLPLGHAAPDD